MNLSVTPGILRVAPCWFSPPTTLQDPGGQGCAIFNSGPQNWSSRSQWGWGEVLSQRMDGLLSTRWLLGHHLSVHKGSRGRSHSSLIPLFSSPLMCGPSAGLICLTSRTPPRSSSFPWGQQSEQSHLLRQLGFTAHISGFPARLFSSPSQFSAQ